MSFVGTAGRGYELSLLQGGVNAGEVRATGKIIFSAVEMTKGQVVRSKGFRTA